MRLNLRVAFLAAIAGYIQGQTKCEIIGTTARKQTQPPNTASIQQMTSCGVNGRGSKPLSEKSSARKITKLPSVNSGRLSLGSPKDSIGSAPSGQLSGRSVPLAS